MDKKNNPINLKLNLSFLKTIRGKFAKLSLPKGTVAVARKEVKSVFVTPLGYILLVLYLGILSLVLFGFLSFLRQGTADTSTIFNAVGISFFFIVPALTMASISKEKQNGTIEFLLTQPVSEFSLVLGKFLAYSSLILLLLVITLPLVLVVNFSAQSPLDFGRIAVQFFGAFLLGNSFAAIGLATSAIFKSEISSLLISLLVSGLFVMLGSEIVKIFPSGLDAIAIRLSLLTQYQSISRGVVDTRDILYFGVFISIFLGITYYLITREKYPAKHKSVRNTQTFIVALTAIVLLISYIGNIFSYKFDLTTNGIYTLSDISRKAVGSLEDILNIKLYASSNLPIQLQPFVRTVEDWILDYQRYSNSKIKYSLLRPDIDDAVASTAQEEGVSPLQIAVNENGAQINSVSYFGVSLKYKDNSKALNLLNDSGILGDFEYNFTKSIIEMTKSSKQKIAFVKNGTEFTDTFGFITLTSELASIYEVSTLDLDSVENLNGYAVVIIGGAKENLTEKQVEKLRTYFANGGSILLMAKSTTAIVRYFQEGQESSSVSSNILSLFGNYGVTIEPTVVYDHLYNNAFPQGSGYFQQLSDYPFWVLGQVQNDDTNLYRGNSDISMIWPSSIKIEVVPNTDVSIKKILVTSNKSGSEPAENTNFAIADLPTDVNSQFTLAVEMQNSKNGKAIVIAASDIIEDSHLSILAELDRLIAGQIERSKLDRVFAFILDSISFLSGEESLGNIKIKDRFAPQLLPSESIGIIIPAIGVGVPVTIVIILGVIFLVKRQNRAKYFEYVVEPVSE